MTPTRSLVFLKNRPIRPASPGRPDQAFASMGIYLFNTAFLLKVLEEDAA